MKRPSQNEDNNPRQERHDSSECEIDVVQDVGAPGISFVCTCKGIVFAALRDLVVHNADPDKAKHDPRDNVGGAQTEG